MHLFFWIFERNVVLSSIINFSFHLIFKLFIQAFTYVASWCKKKFHQNFNLIYYYSYCIYKYFKYHSTTKYFCKQEHLKTNTKVNFNKYYFNIANLLHIIYAWHQPSIVRPEKLNNDFILQYFVIFKISLYRFRI